MARFNAKTPAPEKVRVCLFVNPETYRHLKAQCVIDGTNVSLWFDEQARRYLDIKVLSDIKRRPTRKRYKVLLD